MKKTEEEAQRRLFVLQIVQPGLAGLIDGSISTLAPVFAAALATKKSEDAFLVGLAASIGAGISMAFTEALSDDGSMTGRGRPGAARGGDRNNDGGGWHRTHASIPALRFPCGVHSGGDCCGDGAGHDCVGSESLYGYSTAVGGVARGGGRESLCLRWGYGLAAREGVGAKFRFVI